MTHPSEKAREEIARIIDSGIWDRESQWFETRNWKDRRSAAVAKADAILALTAQPADHLAGAGKPIPATPVTLDEAWAREVLEGERRIRNDYRHSSRITVVTAIRAMLAFARSTQQPAQAEVERDAMAAAIMDMPIEEFRVWAANGTTYPNSYQSSIDLAYLRADRALAALHPQGEAVPDSALSSTDVADSRSPDAVSNASVPAQPDSAAGDVERQWPDIGTDPLKGPRPDDRYEASRLALREAYVRQQPNVPDQTALVWRWHLGTLLEMALRLQTLLARDTEGATPRQPDTAPAVSAEVPGALQPGEVPEWVSLDPAEYIRRRDEERLEAAKSLQFHGSWERYAASLLHSMVVFAPPAEHWGSLHHQLAIVSAALTATPSPSPNTREDG